jgi:hypothetical protein
MALGLKPALAGVQTAVLPFCLGRQAARGEAMLALQTCFNALILMGDWCASADASTIE